jgi:hypothetical protein
MFILQWDRSVDRVALDVTHPVARVELISASIKVLGGQAELDHRTPERSSAAASPRFSRQSRNKAFSSLPMMMPASEPPKKFRRSGLCDCFLREIDIDCGFLQGFCNNGWDHQGLVPFHRDYDGLF